jgi:putative protein kinase ArgK-like GTPase of G3E family
MGLAIVTPFVSALHLPGYSILMKRILLTGMSGTGKSTVIRELARRGYKRNFRDTCKKVPLF